MELGNSLVADIKQCSRLEFVGGRFVALSPAQRCGTTGPAASKPTSAAENI